MPLPEKLLDVTFKHQAQVDDLAEEIGDSQLFKELFDQPAEQILAYLNGIYDQLKKIAAGDSGASAIGATPLLGGAVSEPNVQAVLDKLKQYIDQVAQDFLLGEISDGSITAAKLDPSVIASVLAEVALIYASQVDLQAVEARVDGMEPLLGLVTGPDGAYYQAVEVKQDYFGDTGIKSELYASDIYALAVDADHVYLGGHFIRTVRKLLKTDLSLVSESAAYGGEIMALAVDADHVYLAGLANTVKKLRKTDLVEVAVSANYGGGIYGLTVDADHVYIGGLTTLTVRKLLKTDLSLVAESASYGGNILTLAVDADHVFVGGQTTNTIRKLLKTNLSTVTNSDNMGVGLTGLVIDDIHVYARWGELVRKLSKATLGSTAAVHVSGQLEKISSDANSVYVVRGPSLKLLKYRKADLAQMGESGVFSSVLAVASDEDHTYIAGGEQFVRKFVTNGARVVYMEKVVQA